MFATLWRGDERVDILLIDAVSPLSDDEEEQGGEGAPEGGKSVGPSLSARICERACHLSNSSPGAVPDCTQRGWGLFFS